MKLGELNVARYVNRTVLTFLMLSAKVKRHCKKLPDHHRGTIQLQTEGLWVRMIELVV